jgi:hypothetical protein
MSEKRGIYQGLSFPQQLIEQVEDHISTFKEYKSVTEFFREAVREKLRREQLYFMYKFWGEEDFKRIMEGEPFEEFIDRKFGEFPDIADVMKRFADSKIKKKRK